MDMTGPGRSSLRKTGDKRDLACEGAVPVPAPVLNEFFTLLSALLLGNSEGMACFRLYPKVVLLSIAPRST